MTEKILDLICSKKFYGPIFVFAGAILLYKIVTAIIKRTSIPGKTELEKKRRKTLILLFENIMKYVIAVIAVLLILEIYKVNTTSLVAGLGIAGIVIGLALQDALKDVIGGINIIMEDYFVIGDVVKYNNFTGSIISFGLKTTKIKSGSGEVLIVANRNIDSIINVSQKQAVLIFEVQTTQEADDVKVKKVIDNIIDEVKEYSYVDKKESVYLGIDKITNSSVTYLFKIKCEQGKEHALRREILGKIKTAYQKKQINMPTNKTGVSRG